MITATGQFGKALEAMRTLILVSDTFLGEQTELVTNGIFDEDSGWDHDGDWVIAAGVATVTGPSTSYLEQSGLDLTQGVSYRLSFDLTQVTETVTFDIILTDGDAKTQILATGLEAAQDVDFTLADGDTTTLSIRPTAEDGESATLDNISLVELPVYYHEYNPGDGNDLADCFCVIEPNSDSAEKMGTGTWLSHGLFSLVFERVIPAAYAGGTHEPDAIMDFHNYINAVIDECQLLSGQAGYLLTRSWDMQTGPQRIETEEADDHRLFARVQVAWGLTQ